MFLSGAAVAMNLLHAAHAMGFGANWISNWYSEEEEGRRLVGIAPHEKAVGFVHVGTFTGTAVDRPRRMFPSSSPTIPDRGGTRADVFLRTGEGSRVATRPDQRTGRAASDRLDIHPPSGRIVEPGAVLLLQHVLLRSVPRLVRVRRREGQCRFRARKRRVLRQSRRVASCGTDGRHIRRCSARGQRIRLCRSDAGGLDPDLCAGWERLTQRSNARSPRSGNRWASEGDAREASWSPARLSACISTRR